MDLHDFETKVERRESDGLETVERVHVFLVFESSSEITRFQVSLRSLGTSLKATLYSSEKQLHESLKFSVITTSARVQAF